MGGKGQNREKDWSMNSNNQMKTGLAALAFMVLMAVAAHAQIVYPLYVGSTVPVTNALGLTMPGSWANGPTGSARVEIRKVGEGIVPPNSATGESDDVQNPLVATSYMGKNAIGSNPGLFCEIFPHRLPTNTMFFARVFDPVAAYYADSEPFQAPDESRINVQSSINVDFQSLRPISGQPDVDSDGDGVPDTYEVGVGMNPYSGDSLGDGWGDWFVLMNRDYLSPDSPNWILIGIDGPEVAAGDVVSRAGEDEKPYSVSWWTIPGVWYRLEYNPDTVDSDEYVEVWSGEAPGEQIEVDVDDVVLDGDSPRGYFRVWAMPYYTP